MEETANSLNVEILNASEFTIASPWVIAGCIINALLLVITLISVICALISVRTSYKEYTLQKNRGCKETACDLARVYALEIIPIDTFIYGVLSVSKLDVYLKELFLLKDIKAFSRKELETLLEKKETTFDEVQAKINSIPDSSIFTAKLTTLTTPQERQTFYNAYCEKNAKTGKLIMKNQRFLRSDFYSEITVLLNRLEWFAMSCRYGLADEKLLYQSLHKVYIATVWSLYFFISKNNLDGSNKLYTNVIWLFNEWRNRYEEIIDIEDAQKEEALKRIAEAKEDLDNLEETVFEGTPL